jgi:hypothetical protein
MKARKKIEPIRYRPPLGDIRNVTRGKELLADMIAESRRKDDAMQSGLHNHYCPKCKSDKDCPQITHCRRPAESLCMECEEA